MHHFKRSLSLAGLQAVLTAAAAREPLTYETLAGRTGQSYSTIAVLAGLLSDGRGPRPGLGLLRKIPGEGRRQIKLAPSRTGLAVARVFAKLDLEQSLGSTLMSSDERRFIVHDHLHNRALPALRLALAAAPDIQLSTFCVLLLVCQKQDRFAYHGDHSSIIARKLSLSSLPRNLDRLSEGYRQIDRRTKEYIQHQGYGLVELHKKSTDRRVTLPALSPKGAELMSSVAAALRNKPPSPVRVAKRESLFRASDPEEVRRFSDDDFDDIEWQ